MLGSIYNMLYKRNEQLKFQEEQDIILKNNFNKCPNEIFNLLLLERQINRYHTNLYQGFNFISILSNVEHDLYRIDKYQIDLSILLTSKDLCKNLNNFMNIYNTYTK
jgi:hypothetical protein